VLWSWLAFKCVRTHRFSFSTYYFNLLNTTLYAAFQKLFPVNLILFDLTLSVKETFSNRLSEFHVEYVASNGPGSVVGIATGYELDGPRDRIPVGSRYSAPVQTGPGAHPASCTIGTGPFPGVFGVVTLVISFHLFWQVTLYRLENSCQPL
jgi:hypothetical protein